jgi:hypothetical protein
MASWVFPTITTGVTVASATSGALTGDGSAGDKLSVAVDSTTVDVNGSNQVEAIGLLADWTVANGKALRTDTTTAHTAILQAYDVNGTTYRTFATLTNADVPSFTVSQPSGGILALIPPTADPHVVGAIWNNSGTLAISAG